MPTIKIVRKSDLGKYSLPPEDIRVISKSGDLVWGLITEKEAPKQNPLVYVEISLRKGQRAGLFSAPSGGN